MNLFDLPKTCSCFPSVIGTTITKEEKEKIELLKGCPVNNNIPVKMSRNGFRKACMIHQKYAGIIDNKEKKFIGGRCTKEGWKGSNKHVCSTCKISGLVRLNRPFEIPPNIEFIDLISDTASSIPRKRSNRDHRGRAKLTEEDIREIRKLYENDTCIKELLVLYPQMSRTAMSNIVNRVTWKFV